MKHLYWGIVMGIALLVQPQPAHGASPQLSPHNFNILDRRGYFTPAFKKAVHDLVDAKQTVVEARKEQQKLNGELPDLQRQVAEADGKVAGLQKQLEDLGHVDESDFVDLQKVMGQANTNADVEKQLADSLRFTTSEFIDLKKRLKEADSLLDTQRAMAQAYIWAYPASPHQAEAQKDLQDVQKKLADHTQALADAEAARTAAHDKLVQRAQARDLNTAEWRDYLLSMSKQDIVKLFGVAQSGNTDEWIYTGAYTEDANTHQKVGLVISFNAGRVINVSQGTH